MSNASLIYALVLWTLSYLGPTASGQYTEERISTKLQKEEAVCSNEHCGKISYNEILATYRGMFFTEDEIRERKHVAESIRNSNLHSQYGLDGAQTLTSLPGDGDACCATGITYGINTTMVNTTGQSKYIVHMPDLIPPKYQLVPHGKCVPYGTCVGRCFVEPIFLNLLVYDDDPKSTLWPPILFDWFEIPGYCSCKNVS